MAIKFEYLTESVRGTADAKLNERGAEGWDLVQVVQRGATAVLYLKKPTIETFKATGNIVATKPRGRPKGSKNKP